MFDWGIIAAAIAMFEQWPGFLTGILAIILIGTRQHGIAVLGHDGAHGTICRPKWLNDIFAHVAFLPFGIDLARYRAFHFAHHRFVGTDLDPEQELKAQAAPAWDMPASSRHILLLSAKDFLVWPALRELVPFMALASSPMAFLAGLGFWAIVTLTLGYWPVLLWYTALTTSFWASNRLRIWTEHQGTDDTHCVSATWWQRFLFLPHNIGWHCEHHARPDLAFYQLPLLREKMRTKAVSVGELWAGY